MAFWRGLVIKQAAKGVREANWDEGDEIVDRMREIISKGSNGSRGTLYSEFFDLLNESRGRGRAGTDNKLTAVYKDGPGSERIHGAANVRDCARDKGAEINTARGVSMQTVEEIMNWADEGVNRRANRKKNFPEEFGWLVIIVFLCFLTHIKDLDALLVIDS